MASTGSNVPYMICTDDLTRRILRSFMLMLTMHDVHVSVDERGICLEVKVCLL